MKITITAEGGKPVVLCDHGREGPTSLTPVPMRKIDVLEFVQGIYAKPKNRGNTLNQVTFTASKEHASYTAAQLYLFFLNENIPLSGEVDIELEDQATHLVIRDATVEIAPLPLIGILSTVTFTLKFGRIDQAVQVLDSAGNPILTSDESPVFVNAVEPQELIVNGDFSDGLTGWALSASSPAAGELSVVDSMLKLVCTTSNAYDWLCRAETQLAAALSSKKTYRLQMQIKASAARPARLEITKVGQMAAFVLSLSLTTAWRQIDQTFTGKDDSDILLMIHAGATTTGEIFIDDVSLKEI